MRVIILGLALLALAACNRSSDEPTAEQKQQQQTDALLNQANSQVGIARVQNFTEKSLATQILQLRDQPDLATFTYTQGLDGKFVCVGRSIGYGLPYATQTTNPQKLANARCGQYCSEVPMPQAEPNGLYMPPSADATWILLIDPATGKAHPVYMEPRITVTTFALSGPSVSAPCK
jgi:hypothetical protein